MEEKNNSYMDWGKTRLIPQLYKINVLVLFFIVLGAMFFNKVSFILYGAIIALPICYCIENIWKIPYSFVFQYIRCFLFGKVKTPKRR
ncbi:MAG TPA: hypothetical protein DCM33_02995 [Acinetobacter radioresistens]|jgi:hypothetical protein|nr:hypothetical protein AYJ52_19025 [Acinetobacter pittii]UKC63487.1 hypothetical protein FA267_2_00013 [Acinetobacter nosocomialis]UKC63668.1 hypothetical protein FA648_2_00059 [Acinetobacter nosocomialis]WOF72220.1 hypothetical protein [Acinetobacter junii]HAK13527.1 hypothetical protein [Acinetobacter radioresistens]